MFKSFTKRKQKKWQTLNSDFAATGENHSRRHWGVYNNHPLIPRGFEMRWAVTFAALCGYNLKKKNTKNKIKI